MHCNNIELHKIRPLLTHRTILIRLGFLIVAFLGWLIFGVGFSRMLATIYQVKHKEGNDSDPFDDIVLVDSSVVNLFLGPMWCFSASSVFVFITYGFNTFMACGNRGRILSSLLTFFNFFFTTSAVVTLAICALYEVELTHPLLVTVLPNSRAMLLILIGSAVSLNGLWLGLVLWPLLDITKKKRPEYTELQGTPS